jgi:hypothetical protein
MEDTQTKGEVEIVTQSPNDKPKGKALVEYVKSKKRDKKIVLEYSNGILSCYKKHSS